MAEAILVGMNPVDLFPTATAMRTEIVRCSTVYRTEEACVTRILMYSMSTQQQRCAARLNREGAGKFAVGEIVKTTRQCQVKLLQNITIKNQSRH